MNNIWRITRTKDLISIMNTCKKKFAIIGLTLNNTSPDQKKIIKNFFKVKHIEYPNIIFIYYEVDDNELGKNINLLKNSKDEYPYIYHIYDIDKILVNVSNVNNETINESFNKIKQYYDEDKINNIPLDKSIKILKDKIDDCTQDLLQDIYKRKIIEKK